MKAFKTLFIFTFLLVFTNSVYSQKDETYYFFTTSTLYSDDGNKIIFTDVQHIRCSDMKNGRHTLIKGVEKLLGEHMEEAGTTNWEKYNRLAWCLFDEAAAIKERENQITSYKRDSNNTIIEDSTFDYNCQYIEKK